MEIPRTIEVLALQIARIQEYAPKLSTDDFRQMEENLDEIEDALKALREYLAYLPK